MNLLRHAIVSTRWVLVVLGSILFLAMYLPNTLKGEAALEEYHKTLKEVDNNIQRIKQQFGITGIVVGSDAPVEVSENQESFVETTTRLNRGSGTKH